MLACYDVIVQATDYCQAPEIHCYSCIHYPALRLVFRRYTF